MLVEHAKKSSVLNFGYGISRHSFLLVILGSKNNETLNLSDPIGCKIILDPTSLHYGLVQGMKSKIALM